MTAAIMIQGTGSNVGKSLMVAGLCRCLWRRGLRVQPFKPQNMSNNAAVTVDGGEIGRAQALQAQACGVEPHSQMNPVLLKPESETGAQVVLNGRRLATVKARDYAGMKATLLPNVLSSYHALAGRADIVVVEGAGSPAEINLRSGDIANMGFAEAADVPVLLVGDIDKGGVIAQIVGTHAILPLAERDRIEGFIVNKFRGDVSLFDDGMLEIASRTGWRSIGVLPWFRDAGRLPAEDTTALQEAKDGGSTKIAVPMLSRMANFDDFDPLRMEPAVKLDMVEPGRPLPVDADIVILPGTKSTIADLAFLRAEGWHIDILAHRRRGGRVLGICGGYQMLGKTIADPDGVEGMRGEYEGLGLLDVETVMGQEKTLRRASGRDLASGATVRGYEIHIGSTDGPDRERAWLEIDGRLEGSASRDGCVAGCYMHGLFASDDFRRGFTRDLGATGGAIAYKTVIEETLDSLAAHVSANLDVDGILEMAGCRRGVQP